MSWKTLRAGVSKRSVPPPLLKAPCTSSTFTTECDEFVDSAGLDNGGDITWFTTGFISLSSESYKQNISAN